MSKKKILDAQQVEQIVKRIAFQILESNLDQGKIGLVGVGKQGTELAKLIGGELNQIDEKLVVQYLTVKLDKADPKNTVEFDPGDFAFGDFPSVLVDDVLNTGKTLLYSLTALLDHDPLKVQTAVLVDRGHKQYPVTASYSGYQLATTFEEHIEVKLGANPSVHLF